GAARARDVRAGDARQQVRRQLSAAPATSRASLRQRLRRPNYRREGMTVRCQRGTATLGANGGAASVEEGVVAAAKATAAPQGRSNERLFRLRGRHGRVRSAGNRDEVAAGVG